MTPLCLQEKEICVNSRRISSSSGLKLTDLPHLTKQILTQKNFSAQTKNFLYLPLPPKKSTF